MKDEMNIDREEARRSDGSGRPPITILVNEQEVDMPPDRTVTGAEIKAAAIAQGVPIQSTFVLIEELPNGTNRTVGDTDEVRIRPHSRFTAITPDDNS